MAERLRLPGKQYSDRRNFQTHMDMIEPTVLGKEHYLPPTPVREQLGGDARGTVILMKWISHSTSFAGGESYGAGNREHDTWPIEDPQYECSTKSNHHHHS